MSKIDFLKEQIKKTGYPLEIEISSILDKDWEVINTDSYFDEHEKKLRDIDIRAQPPFSHGLLPLALDFRLIIECKKDEDFAWIFFTRPLKFSWEWDIDGQYLDELQILTKNSQATRVKEIILEKCRLHYNDMNRVAVCFDEFHMQGEKKAYEKKKKEIFEAENQLKKYISYTNEQEMKTQYPNLYRLITYFPCIVFDGPMFEAIVEKGEIKLKKANHVLLTTQNRTSYSNWEQAFLIDVIQKKYFKDFLRILNVDISTLKKKVKHHKRKIEREINSALSLMKQKIV